MANPTFDVTWVIRLLKDIGIENLESQSAIYIGKNLVFHDRTNHIEIDCHFTRDKVLEGLIQLSYLTTQHQLADILTKIFPSSQFRYLLTKLGISELPPSLRGILRISSHVPK